MELDQLVRFVERPVRAFLRRRLGISVWDADDEVEDALSVELDNLETWQVGDRLLKARLAGTEGRVAALAEIARGTLPPGVLGEPVIRTVLPTVEGIVAHVPATSTTSVDVKVALKDGRTLRGTVPGVAGDTLLAVTYSRVNPRHRIAAWVRLLALTAAHPGRQFEALTLGRPASNVDATVAIARIPPLDAQEALDHLEVLLDLYDRGMREPPPLACLTSAAYAAAARAGGDPYKAACAQWESGQFPKEDVEPEHRLVLGELSLDELLDEHARADEVGTYWDQDEHHSVRSLGAALVDGAPAVRGGDAPMSRSISAARCPPASRCSRRAPARARPTRSPRSRPATWRTARRWSKLLLVTFTRMATGGAARARPGAAGELRARVADRRGGRGPARQVPGRSSRWRYGGRGSSSALADFDAATIATIHGFCQEVLGGLGIAGDVERDVEFLEDVSDLVEEVVDDLYVRRFHKQGQPAFTREEAGRIARLAVENPTAPIEPRDTSDDSKPAMRARLADAVRRELELRKQRAAVMTYDDLLTRLDATLAGPGGPVVVRRLRERFKVVLVDEFQDTDPVQWSIVRRAFARRHAGADRRPEAGHLLVPRRRRLRVPGGGARGGDAGHARRQLAQRPGADRRLRRAVRRRAPRPRGHRLPRRDGRQRATRACPAPARRCGSASCTATSRGSISRRAAGTPRRAPHVRTSPRTSPPTSCGCWTRTRASARSPSGPAMSRCWCRRTAPRHSSATRSTRSRSPP